MFGMSLLILVFWILACELTSLVPVVAPTPDSIATRVAEAKAVAATLTAEAPTVTRTLTPVPPTATFTPTPTRTPTNTPSPYTEGMPVSNGTFTITVSSKTLQSLSSEDITRFITPEPDKIHLQISISSSVPLFGTYTYVLRDNGGNVYGAYGFTFITNDRKTFYSWYPVPPTASGLTYIFADFPPVRLNR
jgi:hypothetical protein